MATTLEDMGFKASLADPNVWLAKDYTCEGSTITSGQVYRGHAYYNCIFMYINDILLISEDPKEIMTVIAKSTHHE